MLSSRTVLETRGQVAHGDDESLDRTGVTQLAQPEGRLLPPDVLRERLAETGVDADSEVVASCGSGVNACHTLLMLEAAGFEVYTPEAAVTLHARGEKIRGRLNAICASSVGPVLLIWLSASDPKTRTAWSRTAR
mgnify:CR=1 FL=1